MKATEHDPELKPQAKRIIQRAIINQINQIIGNQIRTVGLVTHKTETTTAVATEKFVGVKIERSHGRSVQEILKKLEDEGKIRKQEP